MMKMKPSLRWWLCSLCHPLRALSSSPRLLPRTISNFKRDFKLCLFKRQSRTVFNFVAVYQQGKSHSYLSYSYVIMHKWQRDKTFRKYADLWIGKVFIPPPDGTFAASAISIPHFSTWGCTSSRVEVAILIFHPHSRMHPNFIGGSASTSVKRSLNLYLQIE